jgi:hypothetical protein
MVEKDNDATLPLIKSKNQRRCFWNLTITTRRTSETYRTVLGFEEIVLESLKQKKPFE